MTKAPSLALADSDPALVERIEVRLGERSYDILVGPRLIGKIGAYLAPLLRRPRLVLVCDETVAALHRAALGEALRTASIDHEFIVLPPGEESKSWSRLEGLTDRLLEAKVERGDLIAALGGGVIGDLVGFAAAILRRGIDFIQIPTTLLAQVDSSVGGKTAINTRHGKNLIGAFHQPRLVLADIDFLMTLPERDYLAGYAEVVKYGLIGDTAFFDWLDTHRQDIARRDKAALRRAVATSCRAKATVVMADERELGERALLNLGHTFGHALEAAVGFGEALRHGEAVALGLALAFDLSADLGLAPASDAARLREHLRAVGLRDTLPVPGVETTADALIAHMAQDKKATGGQIPFILVRGIGRAFICRDVEMTSVRALLQRALGE